jgi:hypothetical protein
MAKLDPAEARQQTRGAKPWATSQPGDIELREPASPELQRQYDFQAKERSYTKPVEKKSLGRRLYEGYRSVTGGRR